MAKRSYPVSKERWLHGCRRAERNYSMLWGSVRRYPSSKVIETQVYGRCCKRHPRADTQTIITEN